MNFGLSETTCTTIRHILERYSKVEKAVIYGSRAKGNYKNGSDIDLTLMGDALDHQTLSEIAGELDDSFIPYTVDLSLYAELNHAKLREHIDRVGVVFYERGTDGQHQAVPEPVERSVAMKKGWKEKSVGEILQLEYGKPLEQSDRKPDGNFPVYGANGEKDRTDKFYHDKPSIIVGRKGSAGQINLTEKKFWPLDVTYFITFDEQQHDLQFLYYLLKTLELTKLAKGVKPGINRNEVYSQKVKVPSLDEQERIVGLLDEAFEGIAIAKANAEKNLQNARALFESHLQSVFTQRGPGWVEKPFEELIESNIIGLTKNSREQGEDKAWPYVKMNNITRDNRFDFSSFTCVDATPEEVSKFSLKNGDFLFNTRNSYELVGKSCIYESDSNDAALYNNNIMRVRFHRGIDARFVLLAFSSKGVADELTALKSGTTNVSAIYFKDLKSLVIPVPPIAEQKKIAAELAALSAETQHLARLYERKLVALEALKKSLLHQAFTGAL